MLIMMHESQLRKDKDFESRKVTFFENDFAFSSTFSIKLIVKELKFGRLGVIVLEPILSITIFTFEVVFVLTIASSSVC